MKKLVAEFRQFIEQGDVVMIAVGLVMALAVKTVIDQLVVAIINPLVALLFGQPDFTEVGFTIADTFFPIGLVLNALFAFLATALVLFLIVKAWNRYQASKPAEPAAETEVDVLNKILARLEARDSA